MLYACIVCVVTSTPEREYHSSAKASGGNNVKILKNLWKQDPINSQTHIMLF